MMIKLKPNIEILDEIPYVLLLPKHHIDYHKLVIEDFQEFLKDELSIHHFGFQSPFEFVIEENDFIICLKQNPKVKNFCAVKILFRSFMDRDIDYKLKVLYSIKQKYNLEIFDGKNHEHLSLSVFELKEHIRAMQELKKEDFIASVSPAYLLN